MSASELNGLPNGTTVALDVDLTDAGNFTGTGDANYATRNGNVTSTIYDSLGRPIVSFDALGNATTTYDNNGNVSTVTNPLGDVTSYAYDRNGQQTAVTTAVGTSAQATIYTGFDANGNVTTQTDALGNVTTTLYDAQNRPTVVIDPLGNRTTTTYDNNGNVSTVTDLLGDVTSYASDRNNRQTAVTMAVGTAAQATTDTGYDSSGNVTTVTDPVGNVTTTLYDTANRPTVVIDALGNRTTTASDANGNVTSVTDPDGRQVLSSFDTNGRMTASTWLAGGTTVNLQTFTFDNNGNELTAQDFSGTVTYTYDKDNRVQSYTNVFGLTLTYAYDQNNDVTLRQDSLGGTLTSTFDAAGRLQTREFSGTDAAGAAVRLDLGYTAANQLSTITHSTNLSGTLVAETTVEGYDNAGRVTAITNFNGSAATLSYYDYQYDKGSRVTTQTYQSAVGTVTFSAVVPYGYDSTNQLTSDGTSTYAFDQNGNRTSVVTGGVTATYSTGTNNELINDGTYTYTYDNAGNNIGKVAASGDTWAYSYDNENHLLSAVEKSDGVHVNFAVTYTYDVEGNRVEQDEWTSGTGVVTTRFNVDPLNGNVWADTDSSNNVLVRYVYGDEPDQILSRTVASGANAGVWFYNVDNLGSVRDLVNASGVVEDHDDYTGFGVVTESNPSVGDRYQYTGGQYDSSTGEGYYNKRYYRPGTADWTTLDPMGFTAGDSNRYRYVGNNALNATDPTGLWTKDAVAKLLAMSKTIGKITLDTIAKDNITVYKATKMLYWWTPTADLRKVGLSGTPFAAIGRGGLQAGYAVMLGAVSIWKPDELAGITMPDRNNMGAKIVPVKWVIVIHAKLNDTMAAITLVHEVTHWRGGDEFAARKSEVEFLAEVPSLLTSAKLGVRWYDRYTTQWLTKKGGKWSITAANEARIRDFVSTLDPPGKYSYLKNSFGLDAYDFGVKTAYTGKAWLP